MYGHRGKSVVHKREISPGSDSVILATVCGYLTGGLLARSPQSARADMESRSSVGQVGSPGG